MILANHFIWLHLPKTGGTSTASLFRKLDLPEITVDPDDVDAKHESIETRLKGINPLTGKKSIITTRRLSTWLLSDWHHKTNKMGINIPFAPVKSGLFYSLRLGGTWVAADYWVHYFKAAECTHTVRLEHLEEDSNRFVLPLLPPRTQKLQFPHRNTNTYSNKIEDFFGRSDLKRIYQNNPAWSAWENKIYGSLLSIKQIERLKAKIGKQI